LGLSEPPTGHFAFNAKATLAPTWREGVQRVHQEPLKLCALLTSNSSSRDGEQLERVKYDYPIY